MVVVIPGILVLGLWGGIGVGMVVVGVFGRVEALVDRGGKAKVLVVGRGLYGL